jgi:tetratricopeptide (TPR) repeat protein
MRALMAVVLAAAIVVTTDNGHGASSNDEPLGLPPSSDAKPSLARPLVAQPSAERSRCFARTGLLPTDQIDACTALIDSGHETTQITAAAFNSRANVNFALANFDLALADYDEAIRHEPGNAIYVNNRGLAHQRKGETNVAVQDFDAAIRLNPAYTLAFINRANAHRAGGSFDLAIQDCDRAIALNPSLAAAFLARAFVYDEKAQWDFDAYLGDGRYEDHAIADYGQVIELDPANVAALRSRGAVLIRRLQFDRAIVDLTEAIRLAPSVPSAYFQRAYALRFAGAYDRAIADYRKILTLAIDEPTRRQVERNLTQLGVADAHPVVPAVAAKR